MSFTLQSEYKNTVQCLNAVFPADEAKAMADRLFEHFFEVTPVQRVMAGKSDVDAKRVSQLLEALHRLLTHEPLQYVLGYAFFMDLKLMVSPDVLIPRPETEEMLSLILKQYSGHLNDRGLSILDIGTGSGCIPIALKHYLPESKVFSVDISDAAIRVAKANAANHKAEIHFINADILQTSTWNSLPAFDLIVSNPPYVTHAEKAFMQSNVLDYEPHTALFVPDEDPLLFYRAIMAGAQNKLREAGALWFEINEMFGDDLKKEAINQGFTDVNIISDIHKKERFLQARK